MLAIVGSRNATAQGLDNARAFARHFSDAGWSIVSGLASGIDGAAHEGAWPAPAAPWPSSAPAPTSSTRRATGPWRRASANAA
jgi:hypothetical protein